MKYSELMPIIFLISKLGSFNGSRYSSFGGIVSANLCVTPGAVLYINVGAIGVATFQRFHREVYYSSGDRGTDII